MSWVSSVEMRVVIATGEVKGAVFRVEINGSAVLDTGIDESGEDIASVAGDKSHRRRYRNGTIVATCAQQVGQPAGLVRFTGIRVVGRVVKVEFGDGPSRRSGTGRIT